MRGRETQVEVVFGANGVMAVKLRCGWCRNLTGALPKDVVWEWLNPFGPVVYRTNQAADECCVTTCSSVEVELHHFAPRNTFADDADDWPVMPLCREHHTEWHTRMDGYRWHRKRVA